MIFGMFFTFFMMSITVLGYILAGTFIAWMAIDAGKQDKFWWMVLILGLPVLGSIVYYFTEKKHDYAKIDHESHEGHDHHDHEHHNHN